MGCWNSTCALTNLPIKGGEKVVVSFLCSSPFSEDHCTPYTYYSLIPFFFRGKYDGYGRVENEEGALIPLIFDKIKQKIQKSQRKEFQSILDVFDIDINGPLIIDSIRDKKLRLVPIFFKRKVLCELLSEFVFDDYDREIRKSIDMSFDNLYSRSKKEVKKLLGEEYGDTKYCEQLKNVIFNNLSTLTFSMNDFSGFALGTPGDLFQEIKDEKTLDAFVLQVCMKKTLDKFMQKSRKMWIPPSGVGSQNVDVTSQRLLAEIVLDNS